MRIVSTKFMLLFAVVCGFLLSASASWYWPFDFDPDSTNKPPRLHRLLEKANEYIELAEDEALEGNGDKAVANYRLALKELDRVELENPDRAESPEFAPLRTKRATCSAAIDSIRFSQVNENERAVAVSNTKDLERKWRFKHGLQTLADEDFARREAAKTNMVAQAGQSATSNQVAAVDLSASTNVVAQTTEGPAATNDVEKAEPPASTGSAVKTETSSESFDAHRQRTMARLRGGDYAAADLAYENLLKERPKDLNLLLLRAAAQAGEGNLFAARRTLEKAMRYHPKSYLPCYNLANLTLQLDQDVDTAREYYEMGRTLGGPRNEVLEKKVNQK